MEQEAIEPLAMYVSGGKVRNSVYCAIIREAFGAADLAVTLVFNERGFILEGQPRCEQDYSSTGRQ